MPSLRALFSITLRIGNLTFGGGEPTMAALQRELVSRKGWISADQYGLSYGLARITPGTNLLAFCAAAGWFIRRWPGAVAAVAAVTVPSAVLAVILTHSYQQLRAHPAALGAFNGIVAAAVGMMAAAAWLLIRSQAAGSSRLRPWALVAAALILSLGFSLSPIPVLALAAITGLLWPEPGKR
jgi:chromate transporter